MQNIIPQPNIIKSPEKPTNLRKTLENIMNNNNNNINNNNI